MTEPSAPGSTHTVGIFGGSFNPPHISHVLACSYALCRWPLNEILIIPSYQHPFGKSLVSFEHRMQMCELAFEHLAGRVVVSRIEEEMGGVSFTIDTVRELKRRLPATQLHLVVGSDILDEADKWKSADELRREAPFLIIPRLQSAAGGAGFYLPEVSSTEVRTQLAGGGGVEAAIPFQVMEYIRRHGLYTGETSDGL